MPAVSFAIPTRFGGAPLRASLASARAEADRAGVGAEAVVVVDGGDADLEGLDAAFPGVRVRRRARPLGFGPSANEAVEAARAPIVSLLNDDMTVEPGYLTAALGALEAPQRFAVQPRVVLAATGETEVGREALRDNGGRPEIVWHVSDSAGPALYANGGGGLFRRDHFLSLGGFDPIFRPFYWEDTDLGYRAWAAGLEVVFVPGAAVLHRHRSTTGRIVSDRVREAIEERNRWLFAWSNLTSAKWTRLLIRGGLAGTWRARAGGSQAAVAGYCLAHARLGPALRRRRAMMRTRRVTDDEILERVGIP